MGPYPRSREVGSVRRRPHLWQVLLPNEDGGDGESCEDGDEENKADIGSVIGEVIFLGGGCGHK